MSSSSSDRSYDVQELMQIGNRCKELQKEKDMLRESQSQSFDLIKLIYSSYRNISSMQSNHISNDNSLTCVQRLEVHVKSLSEARSEDRKHIQKLERELLNCSQEIDYLQDQLNARNAEVHSLGEHVHELELKLSDMDYLYMKNDQLQQELRKSESECFSLTKELERKEVQLRKSVLSVEKLEQSISSLTLDSQCEIESMKLDITALEQACFEANKNQQETILEKKRLDGLIEELLIRVHEAEGILKSIEKENKELREKVVASEVYGCHFLQKIQEWLESKDDLKLILKPFLSELEIGFMPENESACGEILGEFFSKLSILLGPESIFRKQMESMSDRISEYEVLVKQLKEDLRAEKLKAKEEAEDLTQEMAELRYQMTSLLEEECKRRACIEQASLQRIAELEAQIQKEQGTHFSSVRHAHEV